MSQAQIPWSQKVGLPTGRRRQKPEYPDRGNYVLRRTPSRLSRQELADVAFPRHRLERDWLYQDVGLDIARVFTSDDDSEYERAMVRRVLDRIPNDDPALGLLQQRLDQLVGTNVPACDPRWRSLYFDACSTRRRVRLGAVRARTTQVIYAKHFVFGCSAGLAGKYDIPDEQIHDYTLAFKKGGQLCMGTLLEDGTIRHEVLLEKPEGAICYPNLSWDARTLVFSMRDDFETDSYYLYTMDMCNTRGEADHLPYRQGRQAPAGRRLRADVPARRAYRLHLDPRRAYQRLLVPARAGTSIAAMPTAAISAA